MGLVDDEEAYPEWRAFLDGLGLVVEAGLVVGVALVGIVEVDSVVGERYAGRLVVG